MATFTYTGGNLTASTGTTGTGLDVGQTSPALITPVLGAALATSINFGGTTLSVVQDSTFTPVLNFGGATTGITYTNQAGLYSRVGNVVTFSILIKLSSKGSATGAATITGLPVALRAGSYLSGMLVSQNITFTNVPTYLAVPSTTTFSLYQTASGGGVAALTDTNFSATTWMWISGSYLV